MLQLLGLIKHTRLPYKSFPKSFTNAHFRYMSDKSAKPPSGDECKKKEEEKKPVCESKPKATPICKKKESKPKENIECKKKEAKPKVKTEFKKEEPKKDETKIAGGAMCNVKKKPPCPPESIDSKKAKKLSCEELILKREGIGKPKNSCPTTVSGGGPKCPCTPCPKPPPGGKTSNMWKKISLMGVLPLVAILTLLVLSSHHEGERPEFKNYPYMYQRTKPFFWSDGNRGRFHNSHWNALPPDGYEDEIDVEAVGKTAETDKEREERLKEFANKQKEWKKVIGQREAEAKKAQAAAEKEAKNQQAQAEKEAKRQQAEAEKEAKKQQAEADKEAKKQQAEAEKEEKRQRAEAEKERKRQEAEDKKQAKEDTKKVLHSSISEETDD